MVFDLAIKNGDIASDASQLRKIAYTKHPFDSAQGAFLRWLSGV